MAFFVFALIFFTVQAETGSVEGELVLDWLHVVSGIRLRFATTHVRAQITNSANVPLPFSYSHLLPEAALLTNFTIEMESYLAEKLAKNAALASKKEGQVFETTVNVGSGTSLIFELSYEEVLHRRHGLYRHILSLQPNMVLHRRHGLYRHILSLQPNMPVRRMRVLVRINERERLEREKLRVPRFGPDLQSLTNDVLFNLPRLHPFFTHFPRFGPDLQSLTNDVLFNLPRLHPFFTHFPRFGPDLQSLTNDVLFNLPQETGALVQTTSSRDLSAADVFFEPREPGQLAVLYDVQREENAGHLEIVNGYFVHFFAPDLGKEVKSGNRHVIFILDATFTMAPTRWPLLKAAMGEILTELGPNDRYNILTFGLDVDSEHLVPVPATPSNRRASLAYLHQVDVGGAGNITEALLVGVDLTQREAVEESASRIILLVTDGGSDPLQRDKQHLRDSNLLKWLVQLNPITEQVSVHTIGVGPDADFPLLNTIAIDNRGQHLRLLDEAALPTQLPGFFREVSRPVLQDLVIRYMGAGQHLDALVSQRHVVSRDLLAGGELVLSGRVASSLKPPLQIRVVGRSSDGRLVHLHSQAKHRGKADVGGSSVFVERLWSYLTLQNLSGRLKEEPNPKRRADLQATIITLSKKYNFVTDLTSLVVVPLELESVASGFLSAPFNASSSIGASDPAEWLFLSPHQEDDADPVLAALERNLDRLPVQAKISEDVVSTFRRGPRTDFIRHVSRGEPREVPLLSISSATQLYRLKLLQQNLVKDIDVPVEDELEELTLEQTLAATNPNISIHGHEMTEYWGPTQRLNQESRPILSLLHTGTQQFLKKSRRRPPVCSHSRLDIMYGLDLTRGKSWGIGGPANDYLTAALLQRLVALTAFLPVHSRTGLVAWDGSPGKAATLYRLEQNQDPNAIAALLQKIKPGILKGRSDNVFRLAFRGFREARQRGAGLRLVLVSPSQTFRRFRNASKALRQRGVRIIILALHQRDPRKVGKMLRIVGGKKENIIIQPDPVTILKAIC